MLVRGRAQDGVRFDRLSGLLQRNAGLRVVSKDNGFVRARVKVMATAAVKVKVQAVNLC